MNRNILLWIGIGGPAGLLAAAFGFQYLGDLHPCPLCIWQRWPHAAAVAVGIVFLFFRSPLIALGGALALAAGAGIAAFHVGVEFGWWEGLKACTGPGLEGLSGTQLLDFSAPIQAAGCDTPAWIFLGLSMAAWNGLASAALCAVWLMLAFGRPGTGPGPAR